MIKKILTITSIAVLATFMMTMAMTNVAQAGNDVDVDDFECDSFGFFFTPTALGEVSTGSWADCTLIGSSGLTSFLQVTDADPMDVCVELASIEDSFLVNEDGFITFSTSGSQCFLDENGAAPTAAGFCGPGGEGKAFTSTLTGTYTMTGGLVDDERVTGGSGTVDSTADHCTNSGTTTIKGTIETVDE